MSVLQTSAMSKGFSGIRTTWAPDAIPAYAATHPASLPMTSTTMTLSWDIPVVLTLSMHSIATFTAESNPKVKSVLERSLSIVLGTPTTLIPICESLWATPRVSFPPIATRASSPSFLMLWTTFSGPPSILNGLVLEVSMKVPPTPTSSSTMS